MFAENVAWVCLAWYVFIVIVCGIGYVQLYRHYTRPSPPAVCLTSLPPLQLPHITIIRPVKGLEPRLYACLASTFRQTYPRDKLSIRFCVSSRADPAFPVLQLLLRDFPGFDFQVLVEEEDPFLHPSISANGSVSNGLKSESNVLGPNPKIRNMSRAYREARGDVVWIVDCNVWVGRGVAGRMVDLLDGHGAGQRPHKFVHQLPLVVDVPSEAPSPSPSIQGGLVQRLMSEAGGRLEELFMSSSHAKFYTAINTVLLAPCIVGKSNMFRRSHLAALTASNPARKPGIDFFSDNICEDHLIGDILWKKPQPFEVQPPATRTLLSRLGGVGFFRERKEGEEGKRRFGNHALLHGSPCIQPLSSQPLSAYLHRRVRWLRVRKFTVTLATLVEPGTEALLCSLYGAYAATTLPWSSGAISRAVLALGIGGGGELGRSWTAFWLVWCISVLGWMAVDWTLYRILHCGCSIEIDADTPDFAHPPRTGAPKRPFRDWALAWAGREVLAFPVWAWAVFGGVTVEWRGKRFWVGVDMKVREIEETPGGKRGWGLWKRKERRE